MYLHINLENLLYSLKLSTELIKLDVRKYYFAGRVCKPWNNLPEELVTSKNVKLFKNKLKSINLNDFLTIIL